jgi:hypothetical protein
MVQAIKTHIARRGVVSRLTAKLVSDGPLLVAIEEWTASEWRISRTFAQYGDQDVPRHIEEQMFAVRDELEAKIARTPATTAPGIRAKARVVGAVIVDRCSVLTTELVRSLVTDCERCDGGHHDAHDLHRARRGVQTPG